MDIDFITGDDEGDDHDDMASYPDADMNDSGAAVERGDLPIDPELLKNLPRAPVFVSGASARAHSRKVYVNLGDGKRGVFKIHHAAEMCLPPGAVECAAGHGFHCVHCEKEITGRIYFRALRMENGAYLLDPLTHHHPSCAIATAWAQPNNADTVTATALLYGHHPPAPPKSLKRRYCPGGLTDEEWDALLDTGAQVIHETNDVVRTAMTPLTFTVHDLRERLNMHDQLGERPAREQVAHPEPDTGVLDVPFPPMDNDGFTGVISNSRGGARDVTVLDAEVVGSTIAADMFGTAPASVAHGRGEFVSHFVIADAPPES